MTPDSTVALPPARGVYSEFIDQRLGFEQLTAERKRQLRRISELRGGRDLLVYAADLNHALGNAHIINYTDLLPISDQLANLSGDAIDLLLETPGGSGETAEDIVRTLRGKYDDVAVIVPGWAKSAGTIIAMAADEILMGPNSALGPIDAQLSWQGKTYSAGALLEQWEKIRREADETGKLNKAYIPLLQMMSLGELQTAQNQQAFATTLVRDWLEKYKFGRWDTHSTTGEPVTDQEKHDRAAEIAAALGDHSKWLVHGRSIRMADLTALGLKITDYSAMPELADAIHRYHALMQMTFETNAYKLFETESSQLYRFMVPQTATPQPGIDASAETLEVEVDCGNCHHKQNFQLNLGKSRPLQPGRVAFPQNDRYTCPNCGTEHELGDLRRQVEAQTQKKIVE